jgi:hypothetical protein
MNNLDMIAAQHAQKIIAATMRENKANVENVVTKALGVIQEQGIYAGLLYLLSRPDKEKTIAEVARDQLVALLEEEALSRFNLREGLPNKTEGKLYAQKLLDHFAAKVCGAKIPTLLLVKNLFEQTLMYARYSAKARPDDDKEKSS